MENQNQPRNGQNPNNPENPENANNNTGRPGGIQNLPGPDNNARQTDQRQADPISSREGTYRTVQPRKTPRDNLAQEYSYTRALKEYDENETQPQLAEHWKYTGNALRKHRHF